MTDITFTASSMWPFWAQALGFFGALFALITNPIDYLLALPTINKVAAFVAGFGFFHFVCIANFMHHQSATHKISVSILLCVGACAMYGVHALMGGSVDLYSVLAFIALGVYEWAKWIDGFQLCRFYKEQKCES